MTNNGMHRPWHVLAYGNPGVGKSPFAATFPKPLKVFFFDGFGKEWAYLEQGHPTGIQTTRGGGMFQGVLDDRGQLLIEIEYFADELPHLLGDRGALPSAYERFQQSLLHHVNGRWEGFQTAVLDQVTAYINSLLRLNQYKLNPKSKGGADQDARQWYGAAANAAINDLLGTLVWCPIHTVVLGLVDDREAKAGDKRLWGIDAPGKLSAAIPGAFPETYLVYEERSRSGQWESRLMTRSEGLHMARSERRVTDGCLATWAALVEGQRQRVAPSMVHTHPGGGSAAAAGSHPGVNRRADPEADQGGSHVPAGGRPRADRPADPGADPGPPAPVADGADSAPAPGPGMAGPAGGEPPGPGGPG